MWLTSLPHPPAPSPPSSHQQGTLVLQHHYHHHHHHPQLPENVNLVRGLATINELAWNKITTPCVLNGPHGAAIIHRELMQNDNTHHTRQPHTVTRNEQCS